MVHLNDAEGGTMNRKLGWTLGLTMLLIGAIAFGLAAQPEQRGGPDQEGKPPRLDIAGAAEILGVTEDARVAARGLPEGGPQGPGEGPQRGGEHERPDLAAAAEILGITEEALKAALGEPGQGPPDFAAVAAELGITEEALIEALGVPAGGPGEGPQHG